jgi:serine phosphatase RsbU (regulator of sigma subunit)
VPGQKRLLQSGDVIDICDIHLAFYLGPFRPDQAEESDALSVDYKPFEDLSMDFEMGSRPRPMKARPEEKLNAILEMNRAVAGVLHVEVLGQRSLKVLQSLFPQVEWLFLILVDPETGLRVARAYRANLRRRLEASSPVTPDEARRHIDWTIVEQVLANAMPVLGLGCGMEDNLPVDDSIDLGGTRSVMCSPLLVSVGTLMGVFQLQAGVPRPFWPADLDLLTAVASQAAIAIEKATLHQSLLERERLDFDLMLVEQLRKRFLPQSVPKIPGYEFFAHFEPANEVRGDYYDFVPLPGNRWAVALGDVAGKGLPAALVAAKLALDTRTCILTENGPGAAVGALNHLLFAAGVDERFITLCLSILDESSRTLTLCSAGHPPILIRRASGKVEEFGVDIAGFPLGIIPDPDYRQFDVGLEKGDVVVVYSDGVTDSRNPPEELYHTRDNPRLLRLLAETSGGPVIVGRAILEHIHKFSAGRAQVDDLTLVCFGPVDAGQGA